MKLRIFFHIAALTSTFLSGCAKNDLPKKKAVGSTKCLELCLASPVKSLDPHIGTTSPSAHVLKMLHEGLMVRDKDGELQNGLAKSYTISDDNLTYTFYFRESNWSNGESVTAHDFEYAWKKAVLSSHYGALLFSPIKNAGLCNEGKLPPSMLGVKALDDLTLEVKLDHPTPYFLELTSCVNFSPIHQGNKDLTNGPFILKKWNIAKCLTLAKNPLYWDKDTVKLESVHIRIIEDQAVRHEYFEKGWIHWIGDPLAPLSTDAIESKKIEDQVMSVPLNGMNFLVFNTEKYPFNNVNVRKALSLAISREEITSQLLTKSNRPALGLIADGENNYIKDGDRVSAQLTFNSALAELGLTPDQFPEIKLSYCPAFYQPTIMHMIQQEWEETFRIRVKLDPIDKGLLYNKMFNGDFQIGGMFWVSIIKDPIYILDFFRAVHEKMNVSRWQDPAYEKLLDQVDHEVDLDKRTALLKKAESYVMDAMPVIPVCFGSALYMKKQSLNNITVSPFMDVNFKQVTLSEQ